MGVNTTYGLNSVKDRKENVHNTTRLSVDTKTKKASENNVKNLAATMSLVEIMKKF